MRKIPFFSAAILLPVLSLSLSQYGCNEAKPVTTDTVAAPKALSQAELLARGKYIITAGGCSDCHSPKIFTAQGPVPDSTRALSGHPEGSPNLPIDKKALTPGNYMLMGPDITSFVGPFGISYAANLTPDSATGLGAWTEEVFIKTLRTGKHLGLEGGRPILPPMPWQSISLYTDEDLKAMFTYLQAIPAIKNKVPAPVSPPEVAKMK
ncbi:MAG TPA: hypothetical protein VMI12_08185 [Puia sp.]|nr:hypothetical protein [Puia sp.]